MDLQTIIKLEQPAFHVNYTSRMLLLGSCFVENIGEKLEYFRFKTDINPCGIVYNPMAVGDTLNTLIANKRFNETDLVMNEGKWCSFSHHSRFSDQDKQRCLQKINERAEQSAHWLRETDLLIITWGTAWVYRHKASGRLVSNCHKFPAADFERFRLNTEDIVTFYTDLFLQLREVRPELRILFTVSPIRHWKDGAHGNQLSKAVLLLAIDELMSRFQEISYFPSYEIMMDELRDYRYYADDMLHISSLGIHYIWEKFVHLYIPPETQQVMQRVDQLNKIVLHKPFDADNDSFRQLRWKAEEELKSLNIK